MPWTQREMFDREQQAQEAQRLSMTGGRPARTKDYDIQRLREAEAVLAKLISQHPEIGAMHLVGSKTREKVNKIMPVLEKAAETVVRTRAQATGDAKYREGETGRPEMVGAKRSLGNPGGFQSNPIEAVLDEYIKKYSPRTTARVVSDSVQEALGLKDGGVLSLASGGPVTGAKLRTVLEMASEIKGLKGLAGKALQSLDEGADAATATKELLASGKAEKSLKQMIRSAASAGDEVAETAGKAAGAADAVGDAAKVTDAATDTAKTVDAATDAAPVVDAATDAVKPTAGERIGDAVDKGVDTAKKTPGVIRNLLFGNKKRALGTAATAGMIGYHMEVDPLQYAQEKGYPFVPKFDAKNAPERKDFDKFHDILETDPDIKDRTLGAFKSRRKMQEYLREIEPKVLETAADKKKAEIVDEQKVRDLELLNAEKRFHEAVMSKDTALNTAIARRQAELESKHQQELERLRAVIAPYAAVQQARQQRMLETQSR